MNCSVAVEFTDVLKSYQRHSGQLLLRSHVKKAFRWSKATQLFDALKGVSFQIQLGESVAIIGGNGAGKSTLLSLVAGLVPPDRGNVDVNGRVAALLELGSGFHPDLTGKENVMLNA